MKLRPVVDFLSYEFIISDALRGHKVPEFAVKTII